VLAVVVVVLVAVSMGKETLEGVEVEEGLLAVVVVE
jgi:hypothetical protein